MATPYPELDAVLADLVASARAILGDNFCGAYLQGSFAVGDADEHSDVDFVIATEGEVTGEQAAALGSMHERIHALGAGWAQHLEGSYIPRASLRRLDPERRTYLYLDNGSRELVQDNHCNTEVVRWSLRERGIVLAGPDPTSLVDPVPADRLRADVRHAMREWADWLRPLESYSRRGQGVVVLSYCRMLQTLETGTVTTKPVAGEWALGALDPGWAGLVRQALDDRPDPWAKVLEPAAPELIRRTLAFIDYALERAAV